MPSVICVIIICQTTFCLPCMPECPTSMMVCPIHVGSLRTNFSEILIKIDILSFKKMHLEMLSGKWRPFCLSLNVLSSKVIATWIQGGKLSKLLPFFYFSCFSELSKHWLPISYPYSTGVTTAKLWHHLSNLICDWKDITAKIRNIRRYYI